MVGVKKSVKPVVGYDLDGVIVVLLKRDKSYFKQTGAERKLYMEKKVYLYTHSPLLLRPKEKEFFVITARKPKYRTLTLRYFEKHNIRPSGLFMMDNSLTFDNIVEFKTARLASLGVTKYHDDDIKLIKALQANLPDIEFIHIPRTETNVIMSSEFSLPETACKGFV